jgi:alpha-L-rhamnosidase
VDAPKRDRLIWSGDLAVSAPTVYYTNNASDTVAGSLKLFGSFQRSNGRVPGNLPPQLRPGIASGDEISNAYFHSLSYSIHFVTTLYDYYLYTGDKDLVRWGWPVVQKELAYVRNTTNAQHLVVTDASNNNSWHPHDTSELSGTVTEFNALYYQALRGAARLASAIGQDGAGADYEAEAALVKDAINTTLFNDADGIYYISNEIQGPMTVAQDANAMAVLFGVAPPEKRASILQRTADELDTPNGPLAFSPGSTLLSQIISPFISSFETWARFQTGDAAGALDLIRKVWGHMRQGSAYYSGATWEALAPDGTPATRESAGGTFQSLAHGWGSGPTSALSKYVLGVRPVQPGYKTWLIEPQPGDLSWAEGRVPTPHGPITVKWKNASGRFILDVVVPAGTRGTIGIPAPVGRVSIMVNGRPFKQKEKKDKQVDVFTLEENVGGRDGYVYVNDLPPGTHSIVATAR